MTEFEAVFAVSRVGIGWCGGGMFIGVAGTSPRVVAGGVREVCMH